MLLNQGRFNDWINIQLIYNQSVGGPPNLHREENVPDLRVSVSFLGFMRNFKKWPTPETCQALLYQKRKESSYKRKGVINKQSNKALNHSSNITEQLGRYSIHGKNSAYFRNLKSIPEFNLSSANPTKWSNTLVLVFLLLTLNIFHTFFYCFYYWL